MAATGDVEQSEAGLASGIVNTSFMMGGALGLASLASVAGSRTNHLLAAGSPHVAALVGGYRVALVIGAAFAVLAATGSARMLRAARSSPPVTRPRQLRAARRASRRWPTRNLREVERASVGRGRPFGGPIPAATAVE